MAKRLVEEIEVQEMGSFKKKILINKVRQLDKAKMASGETPRSRPFKTREIHMAMKDEKRSIISQRQI